MSRAYRGPDGPVRGPDEAAAAWLALAAPVARLCGGEVAAVDPDVVIRVDGQTVRLPVVVAKRLAVLSQESWTQRAIEVLDALDGHHAERWMSEGWAYVSAFGQWERYFGDDVWAFVSIEDRDPVLGYPWHVRMAGRAERLSCGYAITTGDAIAVAARQANIDARKVREALREQDCSCGGT